MWSVIAVAVVFFIIVLAEYLSRYKGVHTELTRKLVHIFVGVFVAFWPFFLSWRQIQVLSFLLLVGVLFSVRFRMFGSIHAVSRNNLGEVLFALIIGILSLITSEKWIFTAAMLHLSLADGFAAIFGLAWGEGTTYKLMGRTKSLVGSLAFFFTSLIIMVCYTAFSTASFSSFNLVALPVLATIAENVSGEGTDNMVVPLLVALVLTTT